MARGTFPDSGCAGSTCADPSEGLDRDVDSAPGGPAFCLFIRLHVFWTD